jgi:hypothetical protein
MRTKTAAAQKLPHLYEECDASSENNRADDVSASVKYFWGSVLNKLHYGC